MRALRFLPLSKSLAALVGHAMLLGACGSRLDLKPGIAVEREIGGREVHSYRLSMEKGTFISLHIEQPGIDVRARLIGPPGGESVTVFNDLGTSDMKGPDRLAWISRMSGDYRLVVQPRDSAARRGHYFVEFRELRRALPEDTGRLIAEREYTEGLRLLWRGRDIDSPLTIGRFQKALRIWEKKGDKRGQADALFRMAEICSLNGQLRKAVALSEEAVKLARSAEYRSGHARALQALGNAYSRLAMWPQAIESFSQALPLWRELHDDGRQGVVLYSLGYVYYSQNQFDQSLEFLQQARQHLLVTGDPGTSAFTLVAIANIQMDLGEVAQSVATCETALGMARSSQEARAKAVALYCLAAALRLRGELESALELFEESLEINKRINPPVAMLGPSECMKAPRGLGSEKVRPLPAEFTPGDLCRHLVKTLQLD